jgi:transposase-like protein
MVEASRPRGRVDVQVGAGRRRRWSDEAKGRIVAESYAAGAVVRAAPGVDPAWLRDVLRAVKAAT